MDAKQIRRLKPMLTRYLKQFDDCFAQRQTRAHFSTYVEGQLSDLGEKSCEPIAVAAGIPPRNLQEFLSSLQVGRRPHSKPLAGNRDPGPRGPQFDRHHRRNQRREAREQDPRRQAAVVRHGRQDGELHRHRASGLRRRRFPLPVGRRLVSARGLVGRPRPLPRGGHSRRRGVSAEMEDRLGAFRPRPRQRRDVRLADVRRGIRRKTRVFAGIARSQAAFRGRSADDVHRLDSRAARDASGRFGEAGDAAARRRESLPAAGRPSASRTCSSTRRNCGIRSGCGIASRTARRGRWFGR